MKTTSLIYAEDAAGLGLRGLLIYASTYNTRARGDAKHAAQAQRVYRFKKVGENAGTFKRLIEQAAVDLDCAAVWAIPGHKAGDVGHLQRLFGETIRRARTTERRKYNHKAPVDVMSMEFPPPLAAGARVLLVDDVATTGKTLLTIRDHLAEMGIEAVPLVLGLNWRLLPKGFDSAPLDAQWSRAAVEAHGPQWGSDAERKRAEHKAASGIVRRPVGDPARRARLERDPAAWLRHYLKTAYPLPWGQVHLDMIEAAVRAIRKGCGMTVAAPRGTGKSTVLWGVALWAILSGACRFPVVAGYSHAAARRMLRKWLLSLADNEAIQADYPDATQPFEISTHANRLKSLMWENNGHPCGADVRSMDGALMLPDGLGALGAVSIGGNVRGLHAALPDGSTIRPDVLLLDDPQDKSTAQSAPLVRKTIERIESDLFNMAGPDVRLAVMAAVTVIAEADVAEHFLNHPDFEAIRVAQVMSWPTGFKDRASATRKLWETWNSERCEGLADHDGGKRAKVFYKAHKTALTTGAAVSWPQRFDRKRGDPDAIFAALWDFYRIGEAAFMSERQNAPMKENTTVYDLTPALVASKVYAGRNRCDVAPDARLIVAATDLNHYGLHSASAGFANDQTGCLTWYARHDNNGAGLIPKDCPESDAKRRMYEALAVHGQHLAALPLTRGEQSARVGLWLIDSGYFPDVVRRYVEGPGRMLGIHVLAARGYGSDRYRPTPKNVIGQPREQCHLAESPIAGRFLAFNADYWREVSQRAWLGTAGAPGSISLFDGARHSEFAEHICREKLLEKLHGQFGTVWRWATAPGWHDYGDALTMCFVAGAWGGIGTTASAGTQASPRPRYVERRKCKVQRRDPVYDHA
jgi:hypothetical protein